MTISKEEAMEVVESLRTVAHPIALATLRQFIEQQDDQDAKDAARFVAIYGGAFTEEVSDAFAAELEKVGGRPTLDQYRSAIDAALQSSIGSNANG